MAPEPSAIASPKEFYVYVHRRASDHSIFYVGKGCGRRAAKAVGRNRYWQNIVAKHGFVWEIVSAGLTEAEAIAEEVDLIAQLGRDSLCNLTDGGEGMSGFVHDRATLERAADKKRGKKRTAEQRANISASLKGRTLSEAVRMFNSERLKGIRPSKSAQDGFARWNTPQNRRRRIEQMHVARRRAIVCIDEDAQFESMSAAAEWLRTIHPHARAGNIQMCCAGKRRTAYGYRWRYA